MIKSVKYKNPLEIKRRVDFRNPLEITKSKTIKSGDSSV